MSYSFQFTADDRRSMLQISMSGFFVEASVSALAAEMTAALDKLRCEPNDHVTLVDVTACNIQSQQIADNFQALVTDRKFRARRLAFVAGDSPIKMQLRRLIQNASYARVFGDFADAEAWLFRRDQEGSTTAH